MDDQPLDDRSLYDYAKLDDHANWMDLSAEELRPSNDLVAFQGAEFHTEPSEDRAQTLPLSDILGRGRDAAGQGRYLDPSSTFDTVLSPYFVSGQTASTHLGGRATDAAPQTGTGETSSSFHPSQCSTSQEKSSKPQPPRNVRMAKVVVRDAVQVEASRAVRCLSGETLALNKRSAAQMLSDCHERSGLDSTLASIPREPPPKLKEHTRQWILQEPYNVQVGNLQMAMPKRHRAHRPSNAAASASATLVGGASQASRSKRYPCEQEPCRSEGKNQHFTTQGARNKHENVHKPFYCKRCRHHHGSKEVFERHQAKCYASGELEPVSCDVCKKPYSRRDNMIRHVQKKHPEDLERIQAVKRTRTLSSAAYSETATDTAMQPSTTFPKPDALSSPLKSKATHPAYGQHRSGITPPGIEEPAGI